MRTAAIFSDRMVLQREKPIAVWGDGKDGRRVTVTLGGNSASAVIRDGKWRVTLPPMPAADGLTMTVQSGAVTVVYREIAVGEVWLCGGQSNMEFEIKDEKNGEALLNTLTPECGVRFYYTPKQRIIDDSFDAVERNTAWGYATPEGARSWSAVGLYFALELQKKLGVTVGLIGCNWGGTSASVWVSRDVLEQNALLRPYIDDYDNATAGKTDAELIAEFDEYAAYQDVWWVKYSELMQAHPETTWDEAQKIIGESRYPGPMGPKNECRPCGAYETMLMRVCPYTLRGFLYYQGESDDFRPDAYETLLTALIGCWRRDWGDAELPFLNVQLPMFRYADAPDYKHWCRIREAQDRVYRKLRHTGLAVIPDCGELDNIHPKDKSQVGHRLCLQALYEVYGCMDAAEACAPMYDSSYITGNTATVLLKHADGGLRLTGMPCGFELAGPDGVYYPAQAAFSGNRITLTSADVPAPHYVRYAWTNYAEVTVFGMNGLPLAPFRTDSLTYEHTADSEKKNLPSASM
ncbi:MAG: sialate O-acetylesterase [Oscillospiraceae bacterium]|nr:sialate O-acetylesterase [Oscillospiraceae bacterium]